MFVGPQVRRLDVGGIDVLGIGGMILTEEN
jgi:hypothetical protein